MHHAPVVVRFAAPADLTRVAEIYNQGIAGRQATFETTPRNAADLETWTRPGRHFALVAEADGVVVGWARTSEYRPRACYAGVAELSVYVADSARGRGVATRLMTELITAAEAVDLWKLVGRLFPENTGSRALCARAGFREVGLYERHAQLDGVWRDVIIVERLLAPSWV